MEGLRAGAWNMYLFKMALRNVVKNFRRSLFTALAVGAGFAAISVFSGYIHNVYAGLSEQAVRGEGLGHLTIVKSGYFENGTLDPKRYLFTHAELDRIGQVLTADTGVELWTPRLAVSGIVTNGRISTIFLGEGMVPSEEKRLRGSFRPDRGGNFSPQSPTSIAVASDLSRMLGLKMGDSAVLFTTTFDGQANALDADVASIYNTGIAATNDKAILLQLDFARRLADTDGADRIRVLLRRIQDSDGARTRLGNKLRAAGLNVEIRTWKELSSFYGRVKALFDMIFVFIACIVFVIVIMSVTNTMSMSVMERTREIGTLRALGMTRRHIVRLFFAEAVVLAVLGSMLGLAATIVVAAGVNAAGMSYVPPNTSDQVILLVDLVYTRMAITLSGLVVLAIAAAYLPSAGASRKRIVDALGHV
jgi:putative ABC transport system permease protein